ncbi:uncharacterized protein LOC114876301 isoform X2 [Osmia bicornis bicornis]|uniref:uncharacterized protein LOC114876301 isoform X2 n=1 Tax=Osmia bicornis bicornis TaxID=1437191 RepID=UPI001EAF145B|nr:uncharacterized protein LOC114876301 isoform X2 [Osmia bicornis bicornis]
MWLVVLIFYTLKILCIFIFIMYCVITFLMVMYNNEIEELRKCIAIPNANPEAEFPIENRDSVDDKLEVLTEKLAEKEHVLQRSHCAVNHAEMVLNDLENKTSTCRDRYRILMIDLKEDIRKTEDEVKTLQDQISNLSIRREALRGEVIKQQENYQKMLSNFTKEIKDTKTLFSSGMKKSRQTRYCFSY